MGRGLGDTEGEISMGGLVALPQIRCRSGRDVEVMAWAFFPYDVFWCSWDVVVSMLGVDLPWSGQVSDSNDCAGEVILGEGIDI
jgi:hypothetical protein